MQLDFGGVHYKCDLVPLAVVIAGDVEGTAAAGVDVVGRVFVVPGAEVAVVEEEAPAVRGEGDVLVDDAAHAGGGGGLEPGGDGEGVGVEVGGAGDFDIVAEAVEGQGAADFTGSPGRAVDE